MAFTNYTFGVWIPQPGVVRFYEDDVYLRTFTYDEHHGARVAMSARRITGRCAKFEAWSRPSGQLIWEDEFTDLTGWTVGYAGSAWTASGDEATIAVSGDPLSDGSGVESRVLVRDMLGATYFVARLVDIDDTDSTDRWFMIVPYKVGTGRTDDPTDGGLGDDGYRVLVRQRNPKVGGMVPESQWAIDVVNRIDDYVEQAPWLIGVSGWTGPATSFEPPGVLPAELGPLGAAIIGVGGIG